MFSTLDQILSLSHINGLSLERIHARAIPIADNTEDKAEFRCRSFDGFLAEGETLTGVIAEDWDVVHNVLGTTHTAIADVLEFVLLEAARVAGNSSGVDKPLRVCLRREEVDGLPPCMYGHSTELVVRRNVFMSPQHSLFYNADDEAREACCASTQSDHVAVFNDTWAEEYVLTNPALALSALIAGNAHHGMVRFIRHLCFFEGGGCSNPYRVHPPLLLSLLSSRLLPSSLPLIRTSAALAIARAAAEVERRRDLKRQIEAEGLPADHPDMQWANDMLEIERTNAAEVERREAARVQHIEQCQNTIHSASQSLAPANSCSLH